ncbi:TPA: hypothetical protein ACX6PO_002861 [Photobacterium damselae]
MSKKGEALSEFMQNKEFITETINKYYVIKIAYQILYDKEIIHCTYDNFRRLCNQHILNKEANNQSNKKIQSQPQPMKKISAKQDKTDPFRQKRKPIHNPTMTDERRKELFGI